MAGPHRCEVPVIERRDLRLFEALDQGEEARIDDAHREIGVVALQLEAAPQVCLGRALNAVGASQDVLQEGLPDRCRQPLVAPVVELGENERRHDQVLAGASDQLRAATVIGI